MLIIIISGIFISLFNLYKNRDIKVFSIVLLQIFSIVLPIFYKSHFIITTCLLLFAVSILLVLFLLVHERTMKKSKKILIISFLVPIINDLIFGLFNFPWYAYTKLILFISLILFLYILIKRKEYKIELSYIILFTVVVIIKLSGFLFG